MMFASKAIALFSVDVWIWKWLLTFLFTASFTYAFVWSTRKLFEGKKILRYIGFE